MKKVKKIHMMGIGGSGMSGVAFLASKMGYDVTGCDLEESTAYTKDIFKGHSADHIKGADLLVVSPAVLYQNKNNSEVCEGRKKGILITWQEFVGKYLHKNKKVICVAGTHGKSTTTAMAGRLMEDAGLDPSVIIGATVTKWQGNARHGNGTYFLTEADEFNNNFLQYSPEIIILNNIEFDHPDFFKSEDDIFKSFKKFIGSITGQKVLIINDDSPGNKKLLSLIDLKELNLIKFSPSNEKLGFDLIIPGKHNKANALGVKALGEYLKIDNETIRKSLSNFSGIGRRMELIADKNGVKVFDDYAHHPTAITATIQGLHEKYPSSRILAVDEAHGFARTNALIDKYNGAFDGADKVFIGPIFKARDSDTFGITPALLAEKTKHKDAYAFDSFENLKDAILKEKKAGDIILVMGAGKSYEWAREIAELI